MQNVLDEGRMQILMNFIHWCNENSGFFSLILSVIAAIISIVAIRAQNKGVLFEKRTAVYYKTYAIHSKLTRILELYPAEKTPNIFSRYVIAMIIFDIGSEESRIFERLKSIEKERQSDQDNQNANPRNWFDSEKAKSLVERFVEIYVEKYTTTQLVNDAVVFYNEKIAQSVKRIFTTYDSAICALLFLTPSEIQEWLQEVDDALQLFKKERTLKKMRHKLPY